MKIYYAILLITLVSCKNSLDKVVIDEPIIQSVSYYDIMELIVENHPENEKLLYPIEVKYSGKTDDRVNWQYVYDKIEVNSSKKLLRLFEIKQDKFVFDKDSLSSGISNKITQDSLYQDYIIYVFNSFLTNDLKDSIVSHVSVLYSNKPYGGIKGGWEEIIFLSKAKTQWEIDSRIEYIDY